MQIFVLWVEFAMRGTLYRIPARSRSIRSAFCPSKTYQPAKISTILVQNYVLNIKNQVGIQKISSFILIFLKAPQNPVSIEISTKKTLLVVGRGSGGAGEGNRTLDASLGSSSFAIKLHPQVTQILYTFEKASSTSFFPAGKREGRLTGRAAGRPDDRK